LARKKAKTAPPVDTLRAKAEKAVVRKTSLLWLLYSVGSYVIVNAVLIAIWALSDSESPWFLWVLAIWGLGLAFHIAGFIIGFRYGHSREDMIQQQVEEYQSRYEEAAAPAPQPSTAQEPPPPPETG
jgi:F0F1-type ATP synthase assembly protein I